MREAWGTASARAELKGLVATLEAAPGLPASVRSDPLRLSQVLIARRADPLRGLDRWSGRGVQAHAGEILRWQL